jgi:hypothetical protein
MFIRSIEIDGVEENVTIAHTDHGALATAGTGGRVLFEMQRTEPPESRYAKAYEAAKLICGRDKSGRPCATNSMIHEVLTELERVAGC